MYKRQAENSGGTPIPGATFYKYTVTAEDVGKYLYVAVKQTEDDKTESVVYPVTDMISNTCLLYTSRCV